MSCKNCKFHVTQDSGYSNWTVTEIYVSCLKGNFKDIEDSYAWEEKKFYDQFNGCKHFKHSDVKAMFDVDGEVTIEDYKDDQELYNALKENGYT